MKKLQFILFFVLISLEQAWAGLASPSFAPVTININPAAASFRTAGAFGVSANFKEIKTELEAGGGSTVTKNINISKYDLIFAGKQAWLVPELYLSPQNSTKTVSGDQSKSTNKNSFINNQLNIALRPTPFFSIGLKQIYPNLTITNSSDTTTAQANYQYTFKAKYTFLGTGLGSVLKLGPLHLGAEYFKATLTRTVTEGGSGEGKLDRGLKKLGLGAALLFGDTRTNAFRLEASYEQMTQEGIAALSMPEEKGKVIRAEAEFVSKGFYGSVGTVYRKGSFLDFMTLIEDLLYQERMYEGSTVYTWGFGFKPEKGQSFGAKLSYSKTKGEETIIPGDNTKYPAKTTEFAYGVNYSFVF